MIKNLSLSSRILNPKYNTDKRRYQSSNERQLSASNNIFLTENSLNTKYQCIIHYKNYSLFCSTCDKNICSLCERSHRNHKIYNSKNYKPTQKEIDSLKKTIKKYCHDYNLLLDEINFWKKGLDKKISYFIQNIQNFNSNKDINFVNNFDINKTNFYDSMKFRKIYSYIMPNNSNNELDLNNKIINSYSQNDNNKQGYVPFYNEQDFILTHNILKELIMSNDDINDINKFVSCSSMIINYINEFNKKCNIYFKNNGEKKAKSEKNNSKIYKTKTYSRKFNNESKYINDDNKNNYENDKKIIEKFIDFKEYYSQNPKNKIEVKFSPSFHTPKNMPMKSILKNKSSQRYSLKTSHSSNILFKSPNFNSSDSNTINSKKSSTPKIFEGLCNSIEFENSNRNGTVDLILNSSKTIEGNRYLNKSYSVKNNNRLFNAMKNLDLSELKNSSVITKNNNNYLDYNSSEKNVPKFIKKIYNLKKNNFIYEVEQKEKEAKTYIHKKLGKQNNNNTGYIINNKENINKSLNNNNENINGKKNNNILVNSYEEKYNTNNYPKKIFKNNGNNMIKSSLFKILKYSKDEKKQKIEEDKKPIITNNSIKNGNIPKITKTKFDENIIIDIEKPLYIGLDLADTECKLSIINQFNNEIKIIYFKKNEFSIPSYIYLEDNKEDIKIGTEAINVGNTKPNQIIFNLLKFIGIKYDEIIGKKDLWPFKIYKNSQTNRPYIKVNYDSQKEKIFYFEDILTMFIQKLFCLFFNKIILKNDNKDSRDKNNKNKIIKLYLQLSLPNYLNYIQKKIIEKIFQNQIFPDNTTYNGFNVNLQKIKLENSTNIMCLYNEIGNLNNFQKNILSIFIDGCSINLSIVNKKRMLYEVKGIESAGFGEEDFTDNYICYCLRNLDEKINNEFIKSPNLLYQLRKAITLAKKNFSIISQTQTEIIIPSQENNISQNNRAISFLFKKSDFEKSCEEFYKKVILLIKNLLSKSGLSEFDIDDIIIIGQSAGCSKIKSILYDIFKNNKKINKMQFLSNINSFNKEIDNDYLITIGNALQIMNNNQILSSKYLFIDISPFSFGIESLDGLMEMVIQKGKKLPCKNKKLIKISNKSENICINILEGENIYAKDNKFITCAIIDKSNFKEYNEKGFVEVFVQLEIDCDYNLKCYIIEPKSNNRFECLININVVRK